jgi:hypothetical protein
MPETEQNKQVKYKLRVSDHGEVFTNEREVNAMLDLVKQETERIDSRFLEPACGTGNFLVEVLRRKLAVVESRYRKNQLDYERYAIIAIFSIYGVDLLKDNVEECRDRLYGIFAEHYHGNFRSTYKEECLASAKYILSKNIIHGDALTLNTVDNGDEPIVFAEWSAVNGSMIKRRDFKLSYLLSTHSSNEMNLFSDEGSAAYIPQPIKVYPLTHFLKLGEHA